MIRLPEAMRLLPEVTAKSLIAATGALTCLASPACAEDGFRPVAGDVTVHAGPAAIFFDSSAKLEMAGQRLAGAEIQANDGFTGSIEAEVYVAPKISLSLTVGIPPRTRVDGRGILAAVGGLGTVRYGMGAIFVKIHPDQSSRLQPFVAVGAAHFASFTEKGLAVGELSVGNSWGAALQAGADFMLTPRVGIHLSAAHSRMKTNGKGVFGGAPISADITLNPTVLQGGAMVRF